MPLSQVEADTLRRVLDREASGVAADRRFGQPHHGHSEGAPFETVAIAALTSLTNILTRVEILLETLPAGAGSCEVPNATADAPDPKADRKPRGRPAGAKKDPEKAAEAKPSTDGDNPFDKQAPATNGAATKDNTGFAPGGDAAADPLGDNAGEISEADLKALLKEYMGRFGDQGVPKITALLSQFGVKRFQDLPAEKYSEVAAAARKEM